MQRSLLNLSSNWLYMAISSELVKVTLKKIQNDKLKAKLLEFGFCFRVLDKSARFFLVKSRVLVSSEYKICYTTIN
ncbi:hypothetical protein BSPWISOXPB_5560 [uncultured Gammaproteobacteria bacterium]|nr:hypothetical protein BSPWISOXPB_5560 [uncultured Gammaproteobacteria bacterium]